MNRESSRSHAVFTVTVESKKKVNCIMHVYLYVVYTCVCARLCVHVAQYVKSCVFIIHD